MSKCQNFKRTAIAMAVTVVFPMAGVQAADDVEALTSPNVADAAVKMQYLDKINPLYRQYTGLNHEGINGSLDVNVVRRSDDGAWFRIQGRDLGLNTPEFGASYEKQGDWAVGLDYNKIVRYAPYSVQTAVSGIGSNTLVQPSYANAAFAGGALIAPRLAEVTLKTEREITTFNASKYLMEGLKMSFVYKHEDKTGARMSGVRGVAGTGAINLYSGFLFAPEPINQRHQQFEATLDYTTSKLQLSAGYYGSFLDTRNNALTIVGGTNTALYSNLPFDQALSPIALAPDNSSQQLYVNGAYNFTQDTRGNFKIAYSEGKQTDSFLTGQQQAPSSVIGFNLGGKVETTEVSASITSRVSRDLKLLGSWRYEDKKDKTPIRNFATGYTGTYSSFTGNNPESHTTNRAKFEADYNLGSGYALTGGIDYADKKSHEFTFYSGLNMDTKWLREKVSEWTYRAALRKNLSETVNGNLTISRSDREGSDAVWVSGPAQPRSIWLYPVHLADRKRDKVRAMVDWAPADRLTMQFAYEGYFDDYDKSRYGLDKGEGQVFSVDASFQLNDNWKFNAWASQQLGESRQNMQGAVCTTANGGNCAGATGSTFRTGTLEQWDAKLKQNSREFGLGANGKLSNFDLGGQYVYSHDSNKQQISSMPATTCLNLACSVTGVVAPGNGIVPDTKYTQQTVKLFGTYAVSKATKLRLDYVYDYRKMDDYTWTNWVYADGTRVNVKPNQTTQLIGLTLIQSF